MQIPARLVTLNGTLPATLVNLSFTGAKLALSGFPPPGGDAVLTWMTFEAFCRIAWSDDRHCGLDFEEPLAPNILLATRDIYDVTHAIGADRIMARDWVTGRE